MKRYRKRTELEIALFPFIKILGRMPTPTELVNKLGGSPHDWGRILKGQQKIAGEYRAKLECVKKDGIDNTRYGLKIAEMMKEKYGVTTRKGRIIATMTNITDGIYSLRREDDHENLIENENFRKAVLYYQKKEIEINCNKFERRQRRFIENHPELLVDDFSKSSISFCS